MERESERWGVDVVHLELGGADRELGRELAFHCAPCVSGDGNEVYKRHVHAPLVSSEDSRPLSKTSSSAKLHTSCGSLFGPRATGKWSSMSLSARELIDSRDSVAASAAFGDISAAALCSSSRCVFTTPAGAHGGQRRGRGRGAARGARAGHYRVCSADAQSGGSRGCPRRRQRPPLPLPAPRRPP